MINFKLNREKFLAVFFGLFAIGVLLQNLNIFPVLYITATIILLMTIAVFLRLNDTGLKMYQTIGLVLALIVLCVGYYSHFFLGSEGDIGLALIWQFILLIVLVIVGVACFSSSGKFNKNK